MTTYVDNFTSDLPLRQVLEQFRRIADHQGWRVGRVRSRAGARRELTCITPSERVELSLAPSGNGGTAVHFVVDPAEVPVAVEAASS